MIELPRAILIDMDDTILSAYGKPDVAWLAVVEEFSTELGPLSPQRVAAAIAESARTFWQNAEAHWRLKLEEARHEVVRNGFSALTAAGNAPLSDAFAVQLADRFSAYRDEQMFVFPGVHEALQTFKASGVKLALITNGAGAPQRRKIERFALAERFDHIQIEGEHGFGKPEERAYHHAMQVLGVTPEETWMVGDNLEWEVEVPQRLGIYAIWMDAHGVGLPDDSKVRPDRIVRSLIELLRDPER
jgi:putative hydrolase of the HAD superfamily